MQGSSQAGTIDLDPSKSLSNYHGRGVRMLNVPGADIFDILINEVQTTPATIRLLTISIGQQIFSGPSARFHDILNLLGKYYYVSDPRYVQKTYLNVPVYLDVKEIKVTHKDNIAVYKKFAIVKGAFTPGTPNTIYLSERRQLDWPIEKAKRILNVRIDNTGSFLHWVLERGTNVARLALLQFYVNLFNSPNQPRKLIQQDYHDLQLIDVCQALSNEIDCINPESDHIDSWLEKMAVSSYGDLSSAFVFFWESLLFIDPEKAIDTFMQAGIGNQITVCCQKFPNLSSRLQNCRIMANALEEGPVNFVNRKFTEGEQKDKDYISDFLKFLSNSISYWHPRIFKILTQQESKAEFNIGTLIASKGNLNQINLYIDLLEKMIHANIVKSDDIQALLQQDAIVSVRGSLVSRPLNFVGMLRQRTDMDAETIARAIERYENLLTLSSSCVDGSRATTTTTTTTTSSSYVATTAGLGGSCVSSIPRSLPATVSETPTGFDQIVASGSSTQLPSRAKADLFGPENEADDLWSLGTTTPSR